MVFAAILALAASGVAPDLIVVNARVRTMDAYTAGSAFAEFMEEEKGTLEPGKFADFVILSRDIFNSAPEAILQTKTVLTAVAGRVVFEAPDSALNSY